MTSNFIEQFGFNDEEFADQDDVVEWVLFLHLLFKYYHVTQKVHHTTLQAGGSFFSLLIHSVIEYVHMTFKIKFFNLIS